MIKKLLNEYAEKFDDNFPLMLVTHMDEDEIIELIEKCIKEEKPLELEVEEDVDY